MIVNVILAILVLSVIIIVHEFGHFIVAKANGVTVLEFALGLAITLNDKLGHFEKAPQVSELSKVQAAHPGAVVKMVTVDLEQY